VIDNGNDPRKASQDQDASSHRFRRLPMPGIVVAIAALLAVGGTAATAGEPPGGEKEPKLEGVVFERPLTAEEKKRYEFSGCRFNTGKTLSRAEILKMIEHAKKSRTIVKLELRHDLEKGHTWVTTLLGKDLLREARETKWNRYAKKDLAVGRDFADFKHEMSYGTLRNTPLTRYRENAVNPCLMEKYKGTRNKWASVVVARFEEGADRDHHFLRAIIAQDCSLGSTDAGKTIFFDPPWRTSGQRLSGVAWSSGKDTAVLIYALSSRQASKLAPLYAKKYPSNLPADFRIDKTAWARQEMTLALAGMKRAIALPEHRAEVMLRNCLGVRQYVEIPLLKGAEEHDASLKLLKKQYSHLVKWWAAEEESSYWHEASGKLVAKGPKGKQPQGRPPAPPAKWVARTGPLLGIGVLTLILLTIAIVCLCKRKPRKDAAQAGDESLPAAKRVRVWVILIAYASSYLYALMATWLCLIGPRLQNEIVALILWFPSGLLGFIELSGERLEDELGQLWWRALVGYLVYALVLICALIFRKKWGFRVLLGIWLLLLLLNVGGCTRAFEG
jgi:hypothetical protein